MTVEAGNITSGPYTGNGLTDEYDYDFRITDKSQLIVYETTAAGVRTTLTVDTDYTVSGVGVDEGGTVTRVAGNLPSGYKWYIRSNYQPTQETAFASQGGFFPSVHEKAFDKVTYLTLQLIDQLQRSLRFDDGYSGSADPSLAAPVAGAYIRWSNDGSKLINDSDISTIITISGAVATVAGIADEIVTVDGISADVTTVAGIAASVTAVAAIDSDVAAVAAVAANVTTVAGIDIEVAAVAGVAASVAAVAAVDTEVATVAGIAANVTTVAGIDTEVVAVAGIAADVTAVAGIAADVTTAADNIAAIVAAPTHAATATTQATTATTQAGIATTQAGIATTKAAEAAASAALAEAIALGVASGRPTIRPSLVLDFANAGVLDPRVTFTRASTARYFDANGVMQTAAVDECRFHHDPATGEALGVYIEAAATNLLTYSEDFANGAWSKARGTVTSNAITAPDGTLTGDKFVKTNGETGASGVFRAVSQTATIHAVSVYAKAGEVTQIRLNPESPSDSVTAQFDLAAGTIIGTNIGAGTIISQSIEHVGNGWYRCSVVWNVIAGTGQWSVYGMVAGDVSWTGNGSDGFYIWGAQLETGSSASSYIKTEGSTATRAADYPVMTGTNFSSWYNQAEGTFALSGVEWSGSTGVDNNREAIAVTGANSTNRMSIVNSGGVAVGYIDTAGTPQALISDSAQRSGDINIAFAYAQNDAAFAVEGALKGTDTSVTLPIVDRIGIGNILGSAQLNGTIRRLAYYPRRLTNAELQIITA